MKSGYQLAAMFHGLGRSVQGIDQQQLSFG
jgi:hypothetical protein